MLEIQRIKIPASVAPVAFPALRDGSRILLEVDGELFSGRVIRGEGGPPPVAGKIQRERTHTSQPRN